MMKKYTAIALLLAAALTLPACAVKGDIIQVENGGGTPSQTTTEKATEESEESSEQPAEIPEDVQRLIDMFEVDSFTAPDGTEVMLTEASSQTGDSVLCFDFAYIGYAQPVYCDTVIDPDLYDFENYEFREGAFAGLEHTPVKVVKGDVLDNGMTVAEASYQVAPGTTDTVLHNEIILEGECELEGVLYLCGDEEYLSAQDDVLFYPNPTDCAVPIAISGSNGFSVTSNGVDLYSELAFINDGGKLGLGNVHELNVDIADWFADASYVRVRITLDGMRIRYTENFGAQGWSTLKSVEKLDGD